MFSTKKELIGNFYIKGIDIASYYLRLLIATSPASSVLGKPLFLKIPFLHKTSSQLADKQNYCIYSGTCVLWTPWDWHT